ncbi:hypothetical protein H6X68_05520, partial [Actinomyces sp. 186855]|nr:hypothetical protein [Actinomyces sp. 186855]
MSNRVPRPSRSSPAARAGGSGARRHGAAARRPRWRTALVLLLVLGVAASGALVLRER